MSKRLIVYIGENWPAQPSAPWVVLDAKGQVAEQGESDPRYWPAAEVCEAVLSAPQCAWIEVAVPEGGRREHQRLLRYAVEDRIAGDIDHQHLTEIGQTRTDGATVASVLVCDRSRLRAVVTALQGCGRPLTRMYSELQGDRSEPDSWTLAVGSSAHCVLHPGSGAAVALDKEVCEPLLEHLVDKARREGKAPAKLELRCQVGATAVDLGALAQRLALPVVDGAPYCWWLCQPAAVDLLHGEFQPANRRGGLLRPLRVPALVAGAAILMLLFASIVEILWKRQELDAVEQRMHRLFETAVPNTPAVAPPLQIRRHLDDARSRKGLLRQDDLLTLLVAFVDGAGSGAKGAVSKIEYEAGQLKLRLMDAQQLDSTYLEGRLGVMGYHLRQDEEGALLIVRGSGR